MKVLKIFETDCFPRENSEEQSHIAIYSTITEGKTTFAFVQSEVANSFAINYQNRIAFEQAHKDHFWSDDLNGQFDHLDKFDWTKPVPYYIRRGFEAPIRKLVKKSHDRASSN